MSNVKVLLGVVILIVLSFSTTERSVAQVAGYEGTEQGQVFGEAQTDKAIYSPGDTVSFVAAFQSSTSGTTLYIKYTHLNSVIGQDSIAVNGATQVSWKWIPPSTDFQGYMVDIFLSKDGSLLDHTAIGVDVSSSWTRFPRYGFLSSYPFMTQNKMDSIVSVLNRYHINGLQFYDWQYKHNMPLKGTPQAPAPTWNDIANRTNYFSTVYGYIQAAHERGMKAMSYNLLYGAYGDANLDGVNTEWSLYKDTNHQTRVVLQLPQGWASSIYLMDPSNEQWRNYLFAQEDSAFKALAFDGWHIDQLGDWGTMYNYSGGAVVVSNAFTSFIQQAKSFLGKEMVMNAVNQYGQANIAQAPVDFLYTEVWDPSVNYSDLVSIINRNSSYSGGRLQTVLAAYMDRNLGDNPGWFNTAGVLMTDAVIFASGGAHIELGEHMLCKEYFPNSNLQMTDELRQDLVRYYDFLTGYENVLRDSLQLSSIQLSTSSAVRVSSTQQLGAVWYFAKSRNSMQVVQLLNFVNANSLQWRDANGTQATPDTISDLQLSLPTQHIVRNIWVASPDFYDGSAVTIPFEQDSVGVSFTVPRLKYWDMVVIEYDSLLTGVHDRRPGRASGFRLGQNYPNPFNPSTIIWYSLPTKVHTKLSVYDILGETVRVLVNQDEEAGDWHVRFDGSSLPSGVYFYQLNAGAYVASRKMAIVK